MRGHIIPVCLTTVLLCSGSGESKARDHASSPSPAQPSAARPAASQRSSDAEGNHGLGDYVSFPACAIKIRQPKGFEKADSFDGFGDPQTQSSVMATSIPGPYSKVTAGFAKEQMSARGWVVLGRQDVKVDGLPGILVYFEQPARGQLFLKWCLAFGDDRKTTLVTATFPKIRGRELSARLKAAVLSTRLDRAAPPEPAAELRFTIAASPKLKPTRGISRMLTYTKDGVIPAKWPKDPLFIAAPAIGKVVIGDKQQFAERRLRETAETKGLTIKSNDAINIDGLDGYESLAEAKDAKSETPLIVYQVILFDEGSYILMQGLVGTELREEYLPEFKAMAHSLHRKQR